MKLKIGTGLLCLILILSLATVAMAYEYTYEPHELRDELVDPKIPESWFHPPKLASEMGITEFKQSPMLDERVANGELPPVEERLPKDPPVIEPYDHNIGKYGGTMKLVTDSFSHARRIMGHYPTDKAMRFPPSVALDYMVPWMVEDFEYSNNHKNITLHLREGLKWSDGEPLDADDYHFWWEYFLQNKELTPSSPEAVPLLDVTSEDPYTVTFHYQDTNMDNDFGIPMKFGHEMTGSSWLTPEHFMRQFHKEIAGKEEVQEKMALTGHTDWREFWNYKLTKSQRHPEEEAQRPTIRAYIAVKRTAESIIFERNPYYPFVDSEGNQLPYIDRIRLNVLSSNEMVLAKTVTGEVDWEWRYLDIKDLPVIKKNENKGDYRTVFLTTRLTHANIKPNLTHKDPQMRAIFQDVRFRRALSVAINREEINDKYYLGTANPRQQTTSRGYKYYKEEYARAYADYNPEQAKEWLDEMGMIDRDGDGYREMPEGTMTTFKGEEVKLDGGKFNPILIIKPKDPMPVFEMVQKHLKDVGINLRVEQLDPSLVYQRVPAGNYDMYCHYNGFSITTPFTPVKTTLSPFTRWTRWYHTDGEAGEEPPANIKELIDWGETLLESADQEKVDETARKILEAQAENIWTIGIVGDVVRVVVVKNRIKNHPNKGIEAHDHAGVFRPFQFYIEE